MYYFYNFLLTMTVKVVIMYALLFERVTKGCWKFQQLNILNGE